MNKNFGRVVEVMIGSSKFTLDKYNMEGTIPFDNDMLPNESEIRIWNLAQTTINNIKKNDVLMINAGYQGDVGVVLHGRVSYVKSIWEGVDKITTINVLDCEDMDKRDVKEIAFAKNTLASAVMRQIATYIGLPIAQFELNQDYRYQEGFTAKGKVTDIIAEVAKDCGTSVYINKSKLYIRNLRRGGDDVFELSPDTGLIGNPEYFEDGKVKGYNLNMQLQHRVTTASVIDLKSRDFVGRIHVKTGSHTFSRSGDFVTSVEAIM